MDMELTDIVFYEIPEIDNFGKLHRVKKAKFNVNGAPHTIKISMPDFDAGKGHAIIEAEARKIDAVTSAKK